MTVKRVGLVVHSGRREAFEIARRAVGLCASCQVEAVELDVWDLPATDLRPATSEPLDLVVTIGGDGTFLRGVRVAAPHDAPVLGVNVGRVGFLAEVAPDDLDEVLPAALAGRIPIDDRMLLGLRASRPLSVPADLGSVLRYGHGPVPSPPPIRTDRGQNEVEVDIVALNDIVIDKLVRDRQVSVAVAFSRRPFAQYSADALVVSSPTGSTAYSFAAGGPVVSPRVGGMVFTPVAPHMPFNRSLVVGPDEPIGLRVLGSSTQVVLSVDGQLRAVLDPGDWVEVFTSARRARVLRPRESDFYGRLRERFHLADAPAAAADA